MLDMFCPQKIFVLKSLHLLEGMLMCLGSGVYDQNKSPTAFTDIAFDLNALCIMVYAIA